MAELPCTRARVYVCVCVRAPRPTLSALVSAAKWTPWYIGGRSSLDALVIVRSICSGKTSNCRCWLYNWLEWIAGIVGPFRDRRNRRSRADRLSRRLVRSLENRRRDLLIRLVCVSGFRYRLGWSRVVCNLPGTHFCRSLSFNRRLTLELSSAELNKFVAEELKRVEEREKMYTRSFICIFYLWKSFEEI